MVRLPRSMIWMPIELGVVRVKSGTGYPGVTVTVGTTVVVVGMVVVAVVVEMVGAPPTVTVTCLVAVCPPALVAVWVIV